MPKTRKESIFFTAITAWMMVYCMTLYNTILLNKVFTKYTLISVLKSMWIEYVIIFALAYFISGKLAKKWALKIIEPTPHPLFMICTIQLFTVILQVAFASVLGLFHRYGFTTPFISNYLRIYCQNFMIALPLQLIIVGPIARYIFRNLFYR